MIIQPKIKGFICTTAHPEGCKQMVKKQIDYIRSKAKVTGPRHVLIIGGSTGYGLATGITASFAANAETLNVFFERSADERRTASPGWYNVAAYEDFAHRANLYAKSINGDAFSLEIKQQVADLIRKDWGSVDLIIYSVAAPRRVHPQTGHVFSSTLKPIGETFHSKTIDAFQKKVKEISMEPATDEEINNTVAVMGGEDWQMWIDFLAQENLLATHFTTVAYSYLGPELTYPIYKKGTIGKAKEHLKQTASNISQKFSAMNARAFISVNKAVVTQASAAIPVVPLYISLLFKLMKANGTHEGCIEQIYRLFNDFLYAKQPLSLDQEGYIRLDNFEMSEAIQKQIAALWPQIETDNLVALSDVEGYCQEFNRLFGFCLNDIDYNADVDPQVHIASLSD